MTWLEDAACAEVDPELFFPQIGQSPIPAKRICQSCTVTDRCRDTWLTLSLEQRRWGVWWGTSMNDRRTGRPSNFCRECEAIIPRRNGQQYCGPCGVARRAATRRAYDVTRRRGDSA